VDSKIDGVVIIFIDIDALKSSQAAVQEQSAFSAAVVDSAGSLVAVTDLAGGIVRFNRASQHASGYSFEQVRGRIFWEMLWPPDEMEAAKRVYAQVTGGSQRIELEGHWVTRQGGQVPVAWTVTALADAKGAARHIVWVGADITEHQRMKKALETSEGALRRSETQLQALAGSLLIAQEEERRRISRELHDDIGAKLAALSIRTETIQRDLKGKSGPGFEPAMQAVQKDLGVVLDTVRRTAHEMHPSAVEALGLPTALKAYCADVSKQEQVKVRFTQSGKIRNLPPGVGMCCYRVVQEALRNVVEHSGADRAQVSLAESDGSLKLTVKDHGRGFDPVVKQSNGLGIISMNERVRLVGGTFSLQAKEGAGVRIDVEVPLGRRTGRREQTGENRP
jgi:PAS domain S-box-containing protein